MRSKSDGKPKKVDLEGLRLRTDSFLNRYWGLPRGVELEYPADLAGGQLYPLLLDAAEQGLRALVRQDAVFAKTGLADTAPFWGDVLRMVTYANEWVIDHRAADRVPPAVVRKWARFLAGLATYSTICDDEHMCLHAKALETLLIAFDLEKARNAVSEIALKSPPRARTFLEEALKAANPGLSYDRKGSTPEVVEPLWLNIDDSSMLKGFHQDQRDLKERDAFLAGLGLAALPIPAVFAPNLRKVENACYATRNFRVGPEILDSWLREADAGALADYMLVCRETALLFGDDKDCLHLFLVYGPLMLFVVVPLPPADGEGADDPDRDERARLLAGVCGLIREAERAIERGTIRAIDDDFFVIAIGMQVAWCQGGVPEPENFESIAGHFDDKFPLITEWMKNPRDGGVGPMKIGPERADGGRDDGHIPSFEPRGRIATPPTLSWIEVDDWSEAKFKAGVNVHIRTADHDLGRLVARVRGFGWREKPGTTTRVYVLPVSSGRGQVASHIYPTAEQAAAIREVVGEWFRDGARAADFRGFVFDERE
ncbi:MAG: hypothetical protein HUU15_02350 [Candidatus Brocadiae bacterium]|nr:hypothetical protein [Candidatus Brocadiia bacterium]